MTGTGAAWAGDGRSVVVQIHLGAGALETWRLPVDASAPSEIAEDDPLASPDFSFTRDGGQMAFTRGLEHDRALYVANADGTGAAVIRGRGGLPFRPIWSPDGTHIAYLVVDRGRARLRRPGRGRALRIVPGADPGLVHDGWPIFSWSAAGSRILLPAPDDRGRPSLWSVNADGTDRGCSSKAPASAPGNRQRRRPWRPARVDRRNASVRRCPGRSCRKRDPGFARAVVRPSMEAGRTARQRRRGRWNDCRHARLIPVVSFR